jgi:FkbM family methyltransferase
MIKNKLQILARKFLEPFGVALTPGSHFTDDAALKRCKMRGLEINSVIDVGASDGRWSDLCMEHYPDARYLLIEAQADHEPKLAVFCHDRPNAEYVICAAGNKDGTIYFDNDSPLSGAASEDKPESGGIELPMKSIDSLIEQYGLKPPYLIKLDTHGFEVPILEGCRKSLGSTNLVFIETYNFRINKKALKYHEMCTYMENLGFHTIDIVGLMSRDYDGSLWQMDMLFIPSGRKEFDYHGFL